MHITTGQSVLWHEEQSNRQLPHPKERHPTVNHQSGDLVSQAMRASYFIEEAHRRLGAKSILQVAEARLLWFLRDRGPVSRRDLESTFGLGQSTINRQVGTGISKGLVEPSKTSDGRRTQQIKVTPLGLELLDRHTAEYRAAYEAALDYLTDDEQTRFIDMLTTYGQRLAAEASSPGWQPDEHTS